MSMEVFLGIGAWILISMYVISLLPLDQRCNSCGFPCRHDYQCNVPLYVFFGPIIVGAIIGTLRQEFHSIFKWIIGPIGYLAWGLALIGLACAHHKGRNIWLTLFSKDSVRNC